MRIEQFYDKGLAQASYAVVSGQEMAVIDPARDPQPYYDFARLTNARIVAVIETHPHADFVSAHLEMARTTGATLYASQLLGAEYPHQPFDSGDELNLGNGQLRALNTPGHSPDSISVLAVDEAGRPQAVFTGDALFVGDVGRPDLREKVGNTVKEREELARQLYHSTRNQLMTLPPDVLVYPAHGAGSLCGRNISPDLHSTIGCETRDNYALQPMEPEEFVAMILTDQPYVPKYFAYNVVLNQRGAVNLVDSLRDVPRLPTDATLQPGVLVVDCRPQDHFKRGHLPGAFNIQDGAKFETWVGSIVGPDEPFYLIAEPENQENVLRKLAKIGYEKNVLGTLASPPHATITSPPADVDDFRARPQTYTIVDIRNREEIREAPLFAGALLLPLPELRERAGEIPGNQPVMVHCAGGYRSAAGASILAAARPDLSVYDLGEAVTSFGPVHRQL